jgi:ferredoxin
VRVALAALVALAAWGLRAAGAPLSTALALASGFGLAGVGIMLAVSRRMGVMVHCTAWCPMGVAANFLGRLNPFRVRIREGCTGCGVCARTCRYDALDEGRIALGTPRVSCTLCGDCVGSCPHGAMHYAFPGLTHERARALFTVLAVSAHAVFLGVARI